MRLVSFTIGDRASFGLLTDDGVVELQDAFGVPTLRAALERYGPELPATTGGVFHARSEVVLQPPIPHAEKIFCAGVNYKAHREEAGLLELPEFPTLFTRFNDSHVGPDQPVTYPSNTEQLDWEGEIAVVIGRRIRSVDNDDDAMSAIAGFSLYNDLSVRDWQSRASQWIPGKNFLGVGAFGPALVTPDEIDDLDAVRLTTTVNGAVMQDAVVADLIFDIPTLIRYITAFTELNPGDVIVTGTPGGVGAARTPPQFLQPWDEVVIAATGLGELRTSIT